MAYNADQLAFLKNKTYHIWWEPPGQAIRFPDRLLAQIMNMASASDIVGLKAVFSPYELTRVLRESTAGQFFPWSWEEWHLRLGLIGADAPAPPMPIRQIGPDRFVTPGLPGLFDAMWRER